MYKPYQVDYSNSKSRIHMTPGSSQKGMVVVKNTRRDATPSRVQEFVQPFPVQMQHIRLNQLEENYTSQYVDLTPQRNVQKNAITIKQQQSTSQLHASNDMNRINVNLSLKQFQQNPLKQVCQNSGQKTPIGNSSQKTNQNSMSNIQGPGKENMQAFAQNEMQMQLNDIRRQKENICITLSETFKKNQALTQKVQELQNQLEEQKSQIAYEYQHNIECLQEKVVELTNNNAMLQNTASQYSIKIQQLDTQLKVQRQNDIVKINDLGEEINRLLKTNEQLNDEIRSLKKSHTDVLEMNKTLEKELSEAVNINSQLQYEVQNLEERLLQSESQDHHSNDQRQQETSTKQSQPDKAPDESCLNTVQSLSTLANTIPSNLDETFEGDQQIHNQIQIQQLKGMIEMLTLENKILYQALQRKQ